MRGTVHTVYGVHTNVQSVGYVRCTYASAGQATTLKSTYCTEYPGSIHYWTKKILLETCQIDDAGSSSVTMFVIIDNYLVVAFDK